MSKRSDPYKHKDSITKGRVKWHRTASERAEQKAAWRAQKKRARRILKEDCYE